MTRLYLFSFLLIISQSVLTRTPDSLGFSMQKLWNESRRSPARGSEWRICYEFSDVQIHLVSWYYLVIIWWWSEWMTESTLNRPNLRSMHLWKIWALLKTRNKVEVLKTLSESQSRSWTIFPDLTGSQRTFIITWCTFTMTWMRTWLSWHAMRAL